MVENVESVCWLFCTSSEVGPSGTPVRCTYFGTLWMSTCTFSVILVSWLPWVLPWIYVYHFQILVIRYYRKRQSRQGEEPRDIQPVVDPTVEPTTKGDVSVIKLLRKKVRYSGFNGFPSKNSTYALQDNHQFSIGRVSKTFRIDAIIRCMEFAHTFRRSQKNVYGFSKGRERIVRRV